MIDTADNKLFVLCVLYEISKANLDRFYENAAELCLSNKEAYKCNAELAQLHRKNTDLFDDVLACPAETIAGLAAKSRVLMTNIDGSKPSVGNGIGDKRLEMAYEIALNVTTLAKVRS